MSEFAIRVENLSKQYRIGAPSTLRRGSGDVLSLSKGQASEPISLAWMR